MMNSITAIIMLAHIVQAQVKESGLLDVSIGKLSDRKRRVLPLRYADLDSTVFAKPGNLAATRSVTSKLPPPPSGQPHPAACASAASRARWQRSLAADMQSDDAGHSGVLSRRSVLRLGTLGVTTIEANALAVPVDSPVSQAWAKLSGAQPDLVFPDEFLGTWIVFSKLTGVVLPQGKGMVQDISAVERAEQSIGFPQRYTMRFMRNSLGNVVLDRSYNVERLAEAMWNRTGVVNNINWDVNDPNPFRASIIDGRRLFMRVTARSEETPSPDRIETSEVAQVVFDGGDLGVGSPLSRVKSQRTFMKWKFRPIEEAGDGPAIVATQVVYDYLTSSDEAFLESRGEAVTEYTYKMQLFPTSKYPNWASYPVAAVQSSLQLGPRKAS
eukprot:gnl/TRDRNA2_/TRDRNA2_37428_c0_seq1.p1 gnl/TRDRNA2_/TRDRNA2_37428_c0~~gnl/TRDRNA2_/TRDRNA2_37428_c0_seq1.p1  ORF type:complete len:384 (+),score=56.52 gnl/TRDRNA2_/TRDRNA2_37428_c0_seq1:77-1228(+)